MKVIYSSIITLILTSNFAIARDECRHPYSSANNNFNYAEYSMDEGDTRMGFVNREINSRNPNIQLICGFSDLAAHFYKQAETYYYKAAKSYQDAVMSCTDSRLGQSRLRLNESNDAAMIANENVIEAMRIFNRYKCPTN